MLKDPHVHHKAHKQISSVHIHHLEQTRVAAFNLKCLIEPVCVHKGSAKVKPRLSLI